ncbi:MAG: hypothetical protein ACREEZ_08645, partial [Stellaceae bacterium]
MAPRPISGRTAIGAARSAIWAWLAALLIGAALPPVAQAAQRVGSTKPATTAEAAPPAQVRALLTLLADPGVQKWLEQQHPAEAQIKPRDRAEGSVSHYLDTRIGATRAHIVALAAAVPDLPNQFARAHGLVQAELGDRGRAKVLLHLAVFVALGFGAEWLFRKLTARVRRRLDELPAATVKHRLRLIAARFGFAAGLVAAFALGSVGPFLALDWAPLLREMLLGYLVAVLITRIAVILAHFVLSPKHERFRIIPMSNAAARFWSWRFTQLVGWFAFGWVTVGLGRTLGYSLAARQLVAYALGLVLLAIALDATWRRPARTLGAAAEVLPSEAHRPGRGAQNALLSIGFALLWALWVIKAMPSFWLLSIVIVLPLASGVTRRAVDHLLRPPGSP